MTEKQIRRLVQDTYEDYRARLVDAIAAKVVEKLQIAEKMAGESEPETCYECGVVLYIDHPACHSAFCSKFSIAADGT